MTPPLHWEGGHQGFCRCRGNKNDRRARVSSMHPCPYRPPFPAGGWNMVASHLTPSPGAVGPCGRWLCAQCRPLQMSVEPKASSSWSVTLLACGEDSSLEESPTGDVSEEQKGPVQLNKRRLCSGSGGRRQIRTRQLLNKRLCFGDKWGPNQPRDGKGCSE